MAQCQSEHVADDEGADLDVPDGGGADQSVVDTARRGAEESEPSRAGPSKAVNPPCS